YDLFPYTTLFRSLEATDENRDVGDHRHLLPVGCLCCPRAVTQPTQGPVDRVENANAGLFDVLQCTINVAWFTTCDACGLRLQHQPSHLVAQPVVQVPRQLHALQMSCRAN